jgi:hypothetical protein
MISPDTPPGTEIVCLDASPGPYGCGGLTTGEFYTVERVERTLDNRNIVLVAELPLTQAYEPPWGIVIIGFELRRFRYLDIPDALSELLGETNATSECI